MTRNPIRAFTVLTALVAGVIAFSSVSAPAMADGASSSSTVVNPVDPNAPTDGTSTDGSTDGSTTTDTGSTSTDGTTGTLYGTGNPTTDLPALTTSALRALFVSRTIKGIRAVRAMAPSGNPRFYRTANYARWYAGNHIKHRYHWANKQYKCLNTLWSKESGWNFKAVDRGSNYIGIPQLAKSAIRANGVSLRTFLARPEIQVQLGTKYIASRYGSPCSALAHFKRRNWY